MAKREVTGADDAELRELQEEYYDSPLYVDDDIPFDTAYCLRKINYQPDHYDGGQRFCKRRVAKRDDDEFEGGQRDEAAFASNCPTHGGDQAKRGHEHKDNLADAAAPITHGLYADDSNLMMDFTDSEQQLYDQIMENWPEVYNWPPQEDDPARYRILRRIAVNEVRGLRAEDELDGGEIYQEPVFGEGGQIVGHKDVENPISREYRLLMSEVTNQMRELGLTPKERQKMDTLESEQSANEAVSEIAGDAIGDDAEYDPTQFTDESDATED